MRYPSVGSAVLEEDFGWERVGWLPLLGLAFAS